MSVPLIIYLKYINVPNEMRHIIYSFLLFIYTGTSGLACNEAILNRVLKEKKNGYQENQYTESNTLKTHRHVTIKKIGA